MNHIKILVCDRTEDSALEKIRAVGLQVDVNDEISSSQLIETISDYQAIIVRSRTKVTADVIDAAQKLKLIVRGGVGLDTIDVEHAHSKEITVFNTPKASSTAVAELAIGYMFALARQIPQATASLKQSLWEKKRFTGQEINGKNLGIVGIGNIGLEVAWRARALGMNVEAYDPYVQPREQIELQSLDYIISWADYLTFHLPLTSETRNMIGKEQFSMMKNGVRIINCARGGIINEQDLYDALVDGKVSGAALDVFETEPAIGNRLFQLPGVIGTPHIGAATQEAQIRIGEEIAEIIIGFFKG